ncbi:MAG: sugar O-acetyltransferase [Bacteroidota bacterium]|nr:sugar O-acetyltransferase [Bacteroidota bacterium]
MKNTDEKGLLPEEEYNAFNPELIAQRKKAAELTMKFNTSGDKAFMEELFVREMDDVVITAPFHCNYGGEKLKFGKKVYINFNCTFQPCAGIEIGDHTFIGPNVQLYTAIHPVDPEERIKDIATCRGIKIGAGAWIGGGAIILPGVVIGDGVTIGAGSVVTKSIPARSVAVGNPCRVIRSI